MTAIKSWAIRGAVVHGHGRGGSTLGFPTANVGLNSAAIEAFLPLDNGVYCGWASVEQQQQHAGGDTTVFPMVLSLGFNPHFKDTALTVEVHFLHKFTQDFYGATIRVVACHRLREMSAFTTVEALVENIKDDVRQATELLEKVDEYKRWKNSSFFMADAAVIAARAQMPEPPQYFVPAILEKHDGKL